MAASPSTSSSADAPTGGRWPRWGWRLLALLLLWLAASTLWNHYWTAVPAESAIAADGTFDVPVHIRLQERWALNLDFHAGQLPLEEFARRTAPWKQPPASNDVGIALQWRLLDADNQQVVAVHTVFHRLDSWAGDTVSSQMALPPLTPGRYRLVGQLGPLPSTTHGMQPGIAIRAAHGKAWNSWQIGMAWWSSLINTLLVGPLTFALMLALATHMLWRRWKPPLQNGTTLR